eukprot:210203_1
MYSIINLLIFCSQISEIFSQTHYSSQDPRTMAILFAPHVRFDSDAVNVHGGLATYLDRIGESNQNTNTDVSTIPTYYEIYADEISNKMRIKYIFHYAYQASCAVDSVSILNSLPSSIKTLAEDWLSDISGHFGFDEDDIGEHTDGDDESISVFLDFNKLEYGNWGSIIDEVWYGQHGKGYRVSQISGKLELLFGTHPAVYVGVKSHGNYHSPGGIGGCGYFHDFRDGSIYVASWENLIAKNVDANDNIIYQAYDPSQYITEGNGINWEYCETATEIDNNPKLCTPLKCEEKSTGCLVLGVSDGVDAAADIHDKYLIIESTSAPGCNCITKYGQKICKGENIKIDVCTPDI